MLLGFIFNISPGFGSGFGFFSFLGFAAFLAAFASLAFFFSAALTSFSFLAFSFLTAAAACFSSFFFFCSSISASSASSSSLSSSAFFFFNWAIRYLSLAISPFLGAIFSSRLSLSPYISLISCTFSSLLLSGSSGKSFFSVLSSDVSS